MQDHIVKAVTADGSLRAAAALTTATVQEALDRHGLYPVPTAALGRLLTGGLLMAADFKSKERINLRIDGDGPIGQLFVDAGYGEARGYVWNPEVNLPLNSQGKLDVAGAVGKGTLYVIKDLGLKEPWHSSVDLISGEIAEDLTYYLAHSEQIPSAMALGVVVTPDAKVEVAGGFLIQVMPGCPDGHLEQIEAKVAQVKSVTELLKNMRHPETVVKWLLEGLEPQLFEPIPVGYRCKCSRDSMTRALISLGKDELAELAADPDGFETVCHFCNKKYPFPQEEIKDIIDSL
ncbi:MAG: Hsp33 family molecular chaperone HslO [Bacillota bacterium]